MIWVGENHFNYNTDTRILTYLMSVYHKNYTSLKSTAIFQSRKMYVTRKTRNQTKRELLSNKRSAEAKIKIIRCILTI